MAMQQRIRFVIFFLFFFGIPAAFCGQTSDYKKERIIPGRLLNSVGTGSGKGEEPVHEPVYAGGSPEGSGVEETPGYVDPYSTLTEHYNVSIDTSKTPDVSAPPFSTSEYVDDYQTEENEPSIILETETAPTTGASETTPHPANHTGPSASSSSSTAAPPNSASSETQSSGSSSDTVFVSIPWGSGSPPPDSSSSTPVHVSPTSPRGSGSGTLLEPSVSIIVDSDTAVGQSTPSPATTSPTLSTSSATTFQPTTYSPTTINSELVPVLLECSIDNYYNEGTYNLYSVADDTWLWADARTFTSSYESQSLELELTSGDWELHRWDSYGDGGITCTITMLATSELLVDVDGSTYAAEDVTSFYVGPPPTLPPTTAAGPVPILLECSIDNYYDEGTYNLYSVVDGTWLWADARTFTSGYESQSLEVELLSGDWELHRWDTYGDGGISCVVTNVVTGATLVDVSGSSYTATAATPFYVGWVESTVPPTTTSATTTTMSATTMSATTTSVPAELVPVLLECSIDYYYDEGTYNLYSVADGTWLWTDARAFTSSSDVHSLELELMSGDWELHRWDTYGDGGISCEITNLATGATVLNVLSSSYTADSSTPFYVGPFVSTLPPTTLPPTSPPAGAVSVLVECTVDSYYDEATYNIFSVADDTWLWAEDVSFTSYYEAQSTEVQLLPGDWELYRWDTYGDGGISCLITTVATGAILVEVSSSSYADESTSPFIVEPLGGTPTLSTTIAPTTSFQVYYTTVTFMFQVDIYYNEASWNLRFSDDTWYYASNQYFVSSTTVSYSLELMVGEWTLYRYDSYGDGGVSCSVTDSEGTSLLSVAKYDYTSQSASAFTVPFLGGGPTTPTPTPTQTLTPASTPSPEPTTPYVPLDYDVYTCQVSFSGMFGIGSHCTQTEDFSNSMSHKCQADYEGYGVCECIEYTSSDDNTYCITQWQYDNCQLSNTHTVVNQIKSCMDIVDSGVCSFGGCVWGYDPLPQATTTVPPTVPTTSSPIVVTSPPDVGDCMPLSFDPTTTVREGFMGTSALISFNTIPMQGIAQTTDVVIAENNRVVVQPSTFTIGVHSSVVEVVLTARSDDVYYVASTSELYFNTTYTGGICNAAQFNIVDNDAPSGDHSLLMKSESGSIINNKAGVSVIAGETLPLEILLLTTSEEPVNPVGNLPVEVTYSGLSVDTVPANFTGVDGLYAVDVSREQLGVHTLTFFANGASVKMFYLEVLHAAIDVGSSFLTVSGSSVELYVGETEVVPVTLLDIYGNIVPSDGSLPSGLAASAVDSNGVALPSGAYLVANDVYQLKVYSTVDGTYTISVTFDGVHLGGSPFQAELLSETFDPYGFTMEDPLGFFDATKTFVAGTTSYIYSYAHDEFGNPTNVGMNDDNVICAVESNHDQSATQKIYFGEFTDDHYGCFHSHVYTMAGSYWHEVAIGHDDFKYDVGDSPYRGEYATYIVAAGCNATYTTCAGSGLAGAQLSSSEDISLAFDIQPRDQYGNRISEEGLYDDAFSVSFGGSLSVRSHTIAPSVDDDGVIYVVSYTVGPSLQSGTVDVTVWFYEDFVGSYSVPFQTSLSFSASATTAEGQGLQDGNPAGTTLSVTITCRDASGIPLTWGSQSFGVYFDYTGVVAPDSGDDDNGGGTGGGGSDGGISVGRNALPDDVGRVFSDEETVYDADILPQLLSVVDNKDGTHTIKYVSYAADVTTYLYIQSSGQHISGSPFPITGASGPISPVDSEFDDTSLSTVAGYMIGNEVILYDEYGNVWTYDATSPPLIYVHSSGPGEVEKAWEDERDGTVYIYTGSYTAGSYFLRYYLCPDNTLPISEENCMNNNNLIHRRALTLTVNTLNTNKDHCQVTGTGVVDHDVGTERKITIHTYDKYDNPTSYEIDYFYMYIGSMYKYTTYKNGEHSTTFTLTNSGEVDITIYHYGSLLGEFTIMVSAGAPDADESYPTGLSGTTKVGEATDFDIVVKDSYGNFIDEDSAALSVQFLPTDSSTQANFKPSTIEWLGDGRYSVVYTTTRAGIYKCSMKLGGKPIENSGTEVTVSPGSIHASSCTAPSMSSIPASTGSFNLQQRDMYGNLVANTENVFDSPILFTPNDTSTVELVDKTTVVYTFTTPGDYVLTITAGGVEIQGSPMTMSVTTGSVDFEASYFTLSSNETIAGVPVVVEVNLYDVYGNQVFDPDLDVSVSVNGMFAANAVPQIDGSAWTAEIVPTVAGTTLVEVVCESTILSSVVSVEVLPGLASVATSYVHTLDATTFIESVVAGESSYTVLVALDEYGNEVPTDQVNSVQLTLTSESGNVLTAPVNSSTGQFVASYDLTKAGTYKVRYRIDGAQVATSPYTLTVTPAEVDHDLTSVYGPGTGNSVQGVDMTVYAQMYDVYMNPTSTSAETLTLDIFNVATDNSTYVLFYADGDLYTADYRIEGLLESSQFVIYTFRESSDGFAVQVSAAGITVYASVDELSMGGLAADPLPATATADDVLEIVLTPQAEDGSSFMGTGCQDTLMESLSVVVQTADGSNADTTSYSVGTVACSKAGGSYTIPLQVMVAGDYTVSVLEAGLEVSGSPLSVGIAGGRPVAGNTALQVTSATPIAAGDSFSVRVAGVDAYGNSASYRAFDGADAYSVYVSEGTPVPLTDHEDGTYTCEISATSAGVVALHGSLDGEQLSNSGHIQLETVPGELDLSHTVVYGDGSTAAVAGEVTSFSLELSDAYDNILSVEAGSAFPGVVMILGMETDVSVSVQDAAGQDAVYQVAYAATIAGTYEAVVEINGLEEALSVITVSPALSSVDDTVAVVTQHTVVAGQSITVTLSLTDPYGNEQPVLQDALSVWAQHDITSGQYPDSPHAGDALTGTMVSYVEGLATFHVPTMPDGSYSLGYSVNGEAVYDTEEVTASVGPAPAPLSAKMKNSLVEVVVEYDGQTNRAGTSGYFDCSLVFTNTTIGLFGANARCLFTSSKSLSVFLGSGAMISPSVDQVHLLAGVVLGIYENTLPAAAASLTLTAPSSPITPVAVMNAPSEVGVCTDLDLDLSGSVGGGGRDFTYKFTAVLVDGGSPAVEADVQAYLSSLSGSTPSATVPSDLMVGGAEFSFTGQVTDFLGQKASTTKTVTVLETSAPLVQLETSYVSTSDVDDIFVETNVELSPCGEGSEMTWKWDQIWIQPYLEAPDSLSAVESTSRKDLFIKGNSLSPGLTYIFRVTGSMAEDSEASSSDVVYISVGYADLSVSIAGGSRSVTGSFDLTAVTCDPSVSENTCATMSSSVFLTSWECVRAMDGESECSDDISFLNVLNEDATTITIPSGSLEPDTYTFSVTTRDATTMRSAQTSVNIIVAEQSVLDMWVEEITDVNVPVNSELAFYAELVVDGASPLDLDIAWSCTDGDLCDPETGLVDPAKLHTSTDAGMLSIKPNVLTPGMLYWLDVSAVDPTTGASGWASLRFAVNAAPAGGSLTVQSNGGDASTDPPTYTTTDTITYRTSGWIAYWTTIYEGDEDVSATLTYVFGYRQNLVDVIVKDSLANTASAKLPVGSGVNNTLTTFVEVFDEFGGVSRLEKVIRVVNADFEGSTAAASAVDDCISGDVENAIGTADFEAAAMLTVSCTSMGMGVGSQDEQNGGRRLLDRTLKAKTEEEKALESLQNSRSYAAYVLEESAIHFSEYYMTSSTPTQILSSAAELTAETAQLNAAATAYLVDLLEVFMEPFVLADVGGLSVSGAAAALSTLTNLVAAGLDWDDMLELASETGMAMVTGGSCGAALAEAQDGAGGLQLVAASLYGDEGRFVGASSSPLGFLLGELPNTGGCYSPSAVMYDGADLDFNASSPIVRFMLGEELIPPPSSVDDDDADIDDDLDFRRRRPLVNMESAVLLRLPRSSPPGNETRPECTLSTGSAWTVSDDLCVVDSATAEYVDVWTVADGGVHAIQDVHSDCVSATDCMTCGAYDRCGWCAGECVPVGEAGVGLYPATACESLAGSEEECRLLCPTCQNGECLDVEMCECEEGWLNADCDVAYCSMECVHGHCGAPETCFCEYGWEGEVCNTPACIPECQHGTCVSTDVCECDDGWEGDGCDVPICESTCVQGTCVAPNTCECNPQFEGDLCDVLICNEGYEGEDCTTAICSQGCVNGYCTAPDTCQCNSYWQGDSCEEPSCPNGCVHGTCVGGYGCQCEEGWKNNKCSKPICTESCVHGDCVGPDTCDCESGYTGALCDAISCDPECVFGICTGPNACSCDEEYVGAICDVHTTCNGNGAFDAELEECFCFSGYDGSSCDIPICTGGCGSHADCVEPDTCECHAGYGGLAPNCEPICSTCVHGTCVEPGVCICDDDHGGAGCDVPLDCNGKGEYNSDFMGCLCEVPYVGAGCESTSSDCVGSCTSPAGTCVFREGVAVGVCECSDGHSGYDCSVQGDPASVVINFYLEPSYFGDPESQLTFEEDLQAYLQPEVVVSLDHIVVESITYESDSTIVVVSVYVYDNADVDSARAKILEDAALTAFHVAVIRVEDNPSYWTQAQAADEDTNANAGIGIGLGAGAAGLAVAMGLLIHKRNKRRREHLLPKKTEEGDLKKPTDHYIPVDDELRSASHSSPKKTVDPELKPEATIQTRSQKWVTSIEKIETIVPSDGTYADNKSPLTPHSYGSPVSRNHSRGGHEGLGSPRSPASLGSKTPSRIPSSSSASSS